MKTSIIAIANQKGGVGKTSTAVNLAASFAELGKRTLLIDLDYQANASSYLGIKDQAKKQEKTVYHALTSNKSLRDVVYVSKEDRNLHVVSGHMGLSKLAKEKILDPGSAMLLKSWLDKYALKNYDVIIIDTHPSLDLLFQMAMTAAHYYLCPLFAEADPFDGLQYMFAEIGAIKSTLNKQLFFLGLVITKFDKSNATHKQFSALLEQFAKESKISIRGIIPDSKAVASSSSQQRPLLAHRPNLKVTEAHVELATDILPDLKGPRTGRTQNTPKITETPAEISSIFGQTQNAEIFA